MYIWQPWVGHHGASKQTGGALEMDASSGGYSMTVIFWKLWYSKGCTVYSKNDHDGPL